MSFNIMFTSTILRKNYEKKMTLQVWNKSELQNYYSLQNISHLCHTLLV